MSIRCDDHLPEEWKEVLVFHQGNWKRAKYHFNGSGEVRWVIEGAGRLPDNPMFTPPSHWMHMPPAPIDYPVATEGV